MQLDTSQDLPIKAQRLDQVLELRPADSDWAPVVVDSPHSGEDSPGDFGHSMSTERLRMTVDAYVDELFGAAPQAGATFLRALFPRTYIDPNRGLDDIDNGMLDGEWPETIAPGPKVGQGIGLIASRDLYGHIYSRRLSLAEVAHRIDRYYRPYHWALADSIDRTHAHFGFVVHLNCHSMRSQSASRVAGTGMDMCIGDRDGASAGREVRQVVADLLRCQGYRVQVNSPYKGMELVQRYADPEHGRHSVQLEISRGLYMNENLVEKHDGFAGLRRDMADLTRNLCAYARDRADVGPEASAAE